MKAAQAVSASWRETLLTLSALRCAKAGASVAMSIPLDLRREASADRIVRVNAQDVRVLEELPNAGICLARLRNKRIGHHSLSVEAAQRQNPLFERGRNIVG